MSNKIEIIVKFLDDKKAEHIEVFDMRGKDYIVDDVIIATTIGQKHGHALFDYLKPELKNLDEPVLYSDVSDDWIVIDSGDMLIHLMSSEYRSKYNLEEFLSYRRVEDEEE